jgi:outer membrane protein
MSHLYRYLLSTIFCSVLVLLGDISYSVESLSLLHSIDLALTGSDRALDLEETLTLGRMDVASAEHFFTTKIIPLTSVGFTKGTGSQQLGVELRKETSVGTTISYGFVGNRLAENSGYAVVDSTNASAFVRISQGLYRRWGERYNLSDLNSAELRSKQDEIWVERERQSLILQTVQKYYELVLATQLLKQGENALIRSGEHLQSAISRQNIGLVSKVDVYRAELATLDAEAALERQFRARQRSEDAYKELLHIGIDDQVEVLENINKMSPVIPEGWQDTVWQTRLDWQAYRVKMKANGVEVYVAEQNLIPDIGLTGTLEQRGLGNNVEEALELDETNWSLQLQLNSPLDSFNERNVLLRKKMDRVRLRREQDALKRKIILEARDAFLDLLSAEKSHFISRKRLQQAAMALDLAKISYEKGMSNNLDLIDAESAYSEAEVDIARSLTAYNLAAVTFAYNLGVLDREWVEMSLAPLAANPEETAPQQK